MEEIMVSIVCVTYNHSQYIRAALDGFLMQKTNFKYEILVHDDASTDGTTEILKEYKERYPDKINLILQTENQYSKGVKNSVKYMYPVVRGKYVALCEGDDAWIYAGKLQEQFDFLEMHSDVAMYIHNALRIDARTGEKVLQINGMDSGYISDEEIILCTKGSVPTASFFYRSQYIKNLPEWFDKSPVGDNPLRYLCALNGKIYYQNEAWSVRNYMHEGSWNSTMADDVERYNLMANRNIAFLSLFNECSGKRFEAYIDVLIEIYCREIFNRQMGKKCSIGEIKCVVEKCKEDSMHKFDKIYQSIYSKKMLHEIDCLRQIVDYWENIEEEIKDAGLRGEKVFIYGIGAEAEERYLKIGSLSAYIDGFVVSKKSDVAEFKNRRVYGLDDLADSKENTFLWLCMNMKNTLEVIETLDSKGFKNYII